jgi:hypothetical protein
MPKGGPMKVEREERKEKEETRTNGLGGRRRGGRRGKERKNTF